LKGAGVRGPSRGRVLRRDRIQVGCYIMSLSLLTWLTGFELLDASIDWSFAPPTPSQVLQGQAGVALLFIGLILLPVGLVHFLRGVATRAGGAT
jgi:hypothetical protein